MIYSVNVKILKMLKDSRLAPVTKKSLEELLNATQVGQSLNTYLTHIQTWVEEVFDNFKEDKNHLRERIAHDVIYTSLYFYTLLAKHMTNPEIITGIKNDLQKFLDSYEANRQSFVLKNAFDAIKTAYCPRWDFYFQIKLKDDLTTDELVEIYNNWLDCNEELYEFIVFCEKYLHDLYDEDWKNNVFNPDILRGTSHKTQMLGESKDFIISFCESTSRYHSSRQKMISASLHDPISRNTYKGRTFGFMYRFSPDSIIGMSIADAESATFKMNDEMSAISYVLQGTPVDSITKRYEICPIDFKPIYDFWKFRNKTYKYNEILLKEDTEPYGIFTFKESLEKDRTKIFAACITYELPLFTCDQTGNVRYIPLTDVIAVVEGRFPSVF